MRRLRSLRNAVASGGERGHPRQQPLSICVVTELGIEHRNGRTVPAIRSRIENDRPSARAKHAVQLRQSRRNVTNIRRPAWKLRHRSLHPETAASLPRQAENQPKIDRRSAGPPSLSWIGLGQCREPDRVVPRRRPHDARATRDRSRCRLEFVTG